MIYILQNAKKKELILSFNDFLVKFVQFPRIFNKNVMNL